MSTNSTCPVCSAPQQQGILCSACTDKLERHLGDVHAVVDDLNIAMSKQARIGGGGAGGLARERLPLNFGAAAALADLGDTLAIWAASVAPRSRAHGRTTVAAWAARALLREIAAVRALVAVAELYDEVTDAIERARREVDRPADRQYLGQCGAELNEVVCTEELWALPKAKYARCKVCGNDFDVAARQAWLIDEARDQLMNVQEAARVIGSYGHTTVSEKTIRSYVARGQLAWHGQIEGRNVLRLSDLLDLVAERASKPGRKIQRAG